MWVILVWSDHYKRYLIHSSSDDETEARKTIRNEFACIKYALAEIKEVEEYIPPTNRAEWRKVRVDRDSA